MSKEIGTGTVSGSETTSGNRASVRGVILCAGSSQRMGKPKALLQLGGETFLARIVRVFREAGVRDVTVVTGGPHEQRIRDGWAADVAEEPPHWVTNADPSPGPISSLRVGLATPSAEAQATALLFHPVDIPGVEVGDIAAILRAAAATAADVVIPSVEGRRAHPVWLRETLLPRVIALAPNQTLRDLWREPDLTIEHVDRHNPWLRFDADRPDQYELLLRDWSPPH